MDVWTTPFETLSEGSGDCEDLAIGKYLTLKQAGVPEDRLFLHLVFYGHGTNTHMVLSVALDNGLLLVLDNLNTFIVDNTQRTDLKTIFSLNQLQLRIYMPQYELSSRNMVSHFTHMLTRHQTQEAALSNTQAILTASR